MNAKQIPSRRIVFVVVFSLALFGAGTVKTPIHAQRLNAEPELRQIAQQFFATYADRNADRLKSMWSTKAPDRDRFLRHFQQALSDCDSFTVENFQVLTVAIEGGRAEVRVSLTMNAQDRKTRRALWGFGAWQRTLRFVNEEGQWKVLQCAVSEDELAAQLNAAASEKEQDALIAGHRELVTPDLRRALEGQARQMRSRNELGKVTFISQLMVRLGRETGQEIWTERALTQRGTAYFFVGDYSRAADYYLQAQHLSEKLHDDEGLALVCLAIGLMRAIEDENDQAIEYYRRGIAIAERLGDKLLLARLLNNLGTVTDAKFSGDTRLSLFNTPALPPDVVREQIEHKKKVAVLYAAAGNELGAAVASANLCGVYSAAGDHEKSVACGEEDLVRFQALGATSYVGQTLANMAGDYYALGRYEEALRAIERSLALADNQDAIGDGYTLKAKIYRAMHLVDKAQGMFETAIAQTEKQRRELTGGPQTRQRFFASRLTPYREMIDLKATQGKPEDALGYAEMVKARVLLDVAGSGTDESQLLTPDERIEEHKLNSELSRRNRALTDLRLEPHATKPAVDRAQAELDGVRLSYDSWRSSLNERHPEVHLRRGEMTPFNLDDPLNWLDNNTAIAEYAVLQEHCYLFVITREPNSKLELHTYRLQITRKALVDQVGEFQRRLAGDGKGNFDLGYKEQARALYNLLLQPAHDQISPRRNLIVVPEGVLWELPFQALVSPEGKHLLEDCALSYAPSLSVLREMTRQAEQAKAAPVAALRRLLALGNPALKRETIARVRHVNRDAQLAPLPAAEKEVAALRALYGPAQSLVATRTRAREGLFKTEAGRYRILHLATHAFADNTRPMYSALVLSQTGDANEDGLLEAWEIAQLHLNADLVVLSACETARGRVGEGEGMIGLSWAFFLAGAPTTVVSQWAVDSSSTSQLMVEFHRQLLTMNSQSQRPNKAEALRQSALKLMQNESTRHPFFWAGFVVVGVSQ